MKQVNDTLDYIEKHKGWSSLESILRRDPLSNHLQYRIHISSALFDKCWSLLSFTLDYQRFQSFRHRLQYKSKISSYAQLSLSVIGKKQRREVKDQNI